MDLSIVIVSYNTREITRQCLESIRRETRDLNYEVIVVDNNSTDGSVEMIRRDFGWVTLIRNDENKGFAAAQNRGLKHASGRSMFILNSDVFLLDNTAKILHEELHTGTWRLGAVGPQILNADGSVAPSARRAFRSRFIVALGIVNRLFPVKALLPSERWLRHRLGWCLGRWHDTYAPHDSPREVDFVDGMCVLAKREALEETGLFDEQFFFDFEILDLANRLRAKGWTIRFTPRARAVHLGHASRKKLSRTRVETHRSELIYCAKHQPEMLSFVRRFMQLVVGAKLLCLTASGPGGREARELCREILRVCRNFDPSIARRSDRIPTLSQTVRYSAEIGSSS